MQQRRAHINFYILDFSYCKSDLYCPEQANHVKIFEILDKDGMGKKIDKLYYCLFINKLFFKHTK